jgi:hypothetical protein
MDKEKRYLYIAIVVMFLFLFIEVEMRVMAQDRIYNKIIDVESMVKGNSYLMKIDGYLLNNINEHVEVCGEAIQTLQYEHDILSERLK